MKVVSSVSDLGGVFTGGQLLLLGSTTLRDSDTFQGEVWVWGKGAE